MSEISAALDTDFESMDLGVVTARQYLKKLLTAVLMDGESFSGKRPFGNSGWEYELAIPLIKAEAMAGTIDEDGYAQDVDEGEYTEALKRLVAAL